MSKDDIKKCFGKKVKEYRESMNLSQDKFSELAGMPLSTLATIETGRSLATERNIIKICNALNISPKHLFDKSCVETPKGNTKELIESINEALSEMDAKKLKHILTVADSLNKNL